MKTVMEKNVNVVIRLRPKMPFEKSKNMTTKLCSDDRHVLIRRIEKRVSISTVQKKFSFDHVYDEHSTQADIFDKTVTPIINEVIRGFNCTVFAYGQTGTGKTFTIEGELDYGGLLQREAGDSLGPYAGVIPRSVDSIFSKMRKTGQEFFIKVSFLELYNEELIDLLAEEEKPLRIYENGRRNIAVQNLSQLLVKDEKAVYEALKKGVEKRHIAETKINRKSSRSHCVFTLTIHMKETNSEGEGVMKIGTLNLVDLAGSECIARSGAKNNRAKEAGMINTSLLTLGRVVTALVDRLPYVPYRDSKLTRLLQDSLGGKTQTVIIATVSPFADEETLSTLEYATRAKDVLNKPEVNEKLSHDKFFKEKMELIFELQAENECLRNQNGVFLPPEKYNRMICRERSLEDRAGKLQLALDSRQQEINSLQEQQKRIRSELQVADSELKERCEEIKKMKRKLFRQELALREKQTEAERSAFVAKKILRNENALYEAARELDSFSSQLSSDNSYLMQKLQTVEKTGKSNVSKAGDMGRIVSSSVKTVEDISGTFSKKLESKIMDAYRCTLEFSSNLLNNIERLQKEFKGLQNCDHEDRKKLTTQLEGIKSCSYEGLSALENCLKSAAENYRRNINSSGDSVKNSFQEISTRIDLWKNNLDKKIKDSLVIAESNKKSFEGFCEKNKDFFIKIFSELDLSINIQREKIDEMKTKLHRHLHSSCSENKTRLNVMKEEFSRRARTLIQQLEQEASEACTMITRTSDCLLKENKKQMEKLKIVIGEESTKTESFLGDRNCDLMSQLDLSRSISCESAEGGSLLKKRCYEASKDFLVKSENLSAELNKNYNDNQQLLKFTKSAIENKAKTLQKKLRKPSKLIEFEALFSKNASASKELAKRFVSDLSKDVLEKLQEARYSWDRQNEYHLNTFKKNSTRIASEFQEISGTGKTPTKPRCKPLLELKKTDQKHVTEIFIRAKRFSQNFLPFASERKRIRASLGQCPLQKTPETKRIKTRNHPRTPKTPKRDFRNSMGTKNIETPKTRINLINHNKISPNNSGKQSDILMKRFKKSPEQASNGFETTKNSESPPFSTKPTHNKTININSSFEDIKKLPKDPKIFRASPKVKEKNLRKNIFLEKNTKTPPKKQENAERKRLAENSPGLVSFKREGDLRGIERIDTLCSDLEKALDKPTVEDRDGVDVDLR